MSINDLRLNNANKQKSRLQEREEQTRESSNQTKELVQYDKYSGKWYALNPSNGNLILDKAYNSKSAVLRVINKTALGKNIAKPPTEPQPEKRPSEPIGYHKKQVFKFPKPRLKKLQYPIKYLYSVVENGTKNYYVGGFQDKPLQLPPFPFEPTAWYLQNTGQDGFVLGLSRENQIAYYEGFNQVYSTVLVGAQYHGFGVWLTQTSIDNGSVSGTSGTSSIAANLIEITDRRYTVTFYSSNKSFGFQNTGVRTVTGFSNNGSEKVKRESRNDFLPFGYDTPIVSITSFADDFAIFSGTTRTIDFNQGIKPFNLLSLGSKEFNFFGYFVDSENKITGFLDGFDFSNRYSVNGDISKAFVYNGNLLTGTKETFSFNAVESLSSPAQPGYREDYYINSHLYKELTDPELKFECFSGLFCSVKVSESIEDSITAGSRVAVWQVKTYDTQFQLVEDAYYNAWLPHVESGFTVHSTSYYPQQ